MLFNQVYLCFLQRLGVSKPFHPTLNPMVDQILPSFPLFTRISVSIIFRDTSPREVVFISYLGVIP